MRASSKEFAISTAFAREHDWRSSDERERKRINGERKREGRERREISSSGGRELGGAVEAVDLLMWVSIALSCAEM
ncbi:hypothetical protein L484_010096 [Morus notabilis]|uniref:Uncharacterized protein n=1 Tax=Morus notabilis TaxID=981085 RepID=W9SJ28_9ROSA|nr:hypothetical protein L484_010096 [Morus notabilis]